jgi:tetratricopeptide (TPR) repeat protein
MKRTSSLFERFRKLPAKGYYDHLAYYSYYHREIRQLSFEEYIQVKFAYLNALFHLEKNILFESTLTQFLFEIINHDKFEELHKTIYREALLLKAQYLQDQKRLMEAIAVYNDVLKLNPEDVALTLRLKKLFFQSSLNENRKALGVVVILLLATLFIAFLQYILIRPVYPLYSGLVEQLYGFSFLAAIIITGLIFIKSKKQSEQAIQSAVMSRKKKQEINTLIHSPKDNF